MIDELKVLVCSASPDSVNQNSILRDFVGRGFAELLPPGNVFTCSLDYAIEAAKFHRPELIVVFGSCMPASCNYSALRNYCIKYCAKLAFWLHDDPYEFDFNFKIYDYADLIFSNDKWAVTHIDHPRVFHMPLASDYQAHYRPIKESFERELFFCGVGFANRRQFLTDCAEILSPFNVTVVGAEWPSQLSFCNNTRIQNIDLPDFYSGSLATLNIGRRYNLANDRYQLDATTPGPRTFEAAMAGAVQCVYFESPEIEDYFEIGSEVLIFDSPSELSALLSRLIDDPHLRRKISSASQARAIADHMYCSRAKKILNIARNV
jgi:spore maturation protein CgeB